jgi:3D (Asp-Asp-Asp) domain-containing protein
MILFCNLPLRVGCGGIVQHFRETEEHVEMLSGPEQIVLFVTVTAYSPEESQTDNTPFLTAFQTDVAECGIAVSRDLEQTGIGRNTIVEIPELEYCGGTVFVNDRMHYRKRGQIDIFFFDTQKAIEFGIKRNVKIIVET